MTSSLTRSLLRSSLAFAAAFAFALQGTGAAFAATAPGITISNQATATYTDGNNVAYTTNSNTVSTVVQNAPSLSVSPGTAQTVASGATVFDPVTLTNTGNAPGTFTVTGDTSSAGTPLGYAIPGSTVCPTVLTATVTTYCTAAQVSAALPSTAPNGTQIVDVVYQAPDGTGSTTPVTSTQTLTATITQAATTASAGPPAIAAVPAATSASVTDTTGETDNILPQARLDIQKSVTAPTTSTAPITFTIAANNGGSFDATDLTSAENILNATTANTVTKPGILITDRIPTFTPTGGTATQLLLTAAPTASLATALAGQTAQVFLTTSATGTTGWVPASTFNATTAYTYVGVYVSGSTATETVTENGTATTVPYELVSNPGSSAGNVPTPQVTISLSVAQPTGAGDTNANAISNIANSIIGGNPNGNGQTPVIGPTIPDGVPDGTTTAATDIGNAIANTTPSSNKVPPGGASNTVTAAAFASVTVQNGPYGVPNAEGVYPGSTATAPTTQLDFTAVGTTCTTTPATTSTGTTFAGGPCLTSAPVVVPATFQNTGNATDNYNFQVVAPPGFTAQVFLATCPGTAPVATAIKGITCTQGAAVTAVSTAGGTIASTATTPVAQGASQSYEVVYTPTTADPAFTPVDSTVTVAGSAATGFTQSADANTTHFDLYPGGPIELQKAVALDCGTATTFTAPSATNQVVPGCYVQYTVTYVNEASANSVTPTNLGATSAGPPSTAPEPAFAYAALSIPAGGNLVITEDGGTTALPAGSTNNWFTYSGGLVTSPVGGTSAAPTSTGPITPTYAYFTQTNTAATAAAGAAKFTATFAGPVAPGATGSVSFVVKVN